MYSQNKQIKCLNCYQYAGELTAFGSSHYDAFIASTQTSGDGVRNLSVRLVKLLRQTNRLS